MVKKFLKTGLFLAVTMLVFTGCRTAPIYNVSHKAVVPTSYSKMQRAILLAGNSLGWQMSRVRKGLIRGKLVLRSHVAIVNIYYSGSSYSIKYVKSVNLKYDPQKGTIHNNYNGWIQNLEKAIDARLI